MSLSTTTPLTRDVSSRDPPTFPSTLISSKSTSLRVKSATDRTASTAIDANLSCAIETLHCKPERGEGDAHLAPQCCFGCLQQIANVIFCKFNLAPSGPSFHLQDGAYGICDPIKLLHRYLASLLVPVRYPYGMYATINQR